MVVSIIELKSLYDDINKIYSKSVIDSNVKDYLEHINNVLMETGNKRNGLFQADYDMAGINTNPETVFRFSPFISSVKYIFNINNFLSICKTIEEKLVENNSSVYADAVFILERRFITCVVEFDGFFHKHYEGISHYFEMVDKELSRTKRLDGFSTYEYSCRYNISGEQGKQEIILPSISILTPENTANYSEERVPGSINSTTQYDDQIMLTDIIKENTSKHEDILDPYDVKHMASETSAFLCDLAENMSEQTAKDFLLFLNNLEPNIREINFIEKNRNIIEDWDNNIIIVSSLIKELTNGIDSNGRQFVSISDDLFNKLLSCGWIDKIIRDDGYCNIDYIILRLKGYGLIPSEYITYSAGINNRVSLDDSDAKISMISIDIQERGFCFSNKAIENNILKENDNRIIRNPIITIYMPALYQLLPEKIAQSLFHIQRLIIDRSIIGNEMFAIHLNDELHKIVRDNSELFSTLLSSQSDFYTFLEERCQNTEIPSRHKELLYRSIVDFCNVVGLSTPIERVYLDQWIGQADIDRLQSNKDMMFRASSETHKYLYHDSPQAGYNTDNPYRITRVPVVIRTNGEELVYDNYCISESIDAQGLRNANILSNEDMQKVETLLFSRSSDDSIYEKLILENDIMLIISELIATQSSDNKCLDFLINMMFESKGYELVKSFDDEQLLIDETQCDIRITEVDEKQKHDTYQNAIFGLKKKGTVIIRPRCELLKYQPSLLLNKFVGFINENLPSIHANEEMSFIKTLIESLIKNKKLLEGTQLSYLNSYQKKDWVLRNNSLSFLFENNIENELLNAAEIFNTENSLSKVASDFNYYYKQFSDEWEDVVNQLSENGIRRIEIIPGKTIVTDAELNKGWQVRNDHKKYTNEHNKDLLVYDVIRQGLEVDDMVIREPIVNTYTYRD